MRSWRSPLGGSERERLVARLAAAGRSMELLSDESGSALAVLPYGGRLLGAFAPAAGANFLWTNPMLESSESARRLLDSGTWANSGGERCWIAPEADFFLPDYPATSSYFQPRGLDPGDYSATRDEKFIRLRNRLELHSFRTGEDLELLIAKEYALLPLDDRAALAAEGISAVAYRAILELELLSPAPETPVGLWSLLQLPPGGTMLAATRGRAKPVAYFGSVAEEELHIDDATFRWNTQGVHDRKLGIAPNELRGRIGYAYESEGSSCLVVRDIEVDPRGLYIDAPYPKKTSTAAEQPCAAEFCAVDDPALGSFRELEYHSPAIGGKNSLSRISSESLVRCYRGRREGIRCLESALFGKPSDQ
jgi:hypothetical protein